MAFVEER